MKNIIFLTLLSLPILSLQAKERVNLTEIFAQTEKAANKAEDNLEANALLDRADEIDQRHELKTSEGLAQLAKKSRIKTDLLLACSLRGKDLAKDYGIKLNCKTEVQKAMTSGFSVNEIMEILDY